MHYATLKFFLIQLFICCCCCCCRDLRWDSIEANMIKSSETRPSDPRMMKENAAVSFAVIDLPDQA
jgi:hypothetical protein